MGPSVQPVMVDFKRLNKLAKKTHTQLKLFRELLFYVFLFMLLFIFFFFLTLEKKIKMHLKICTTQFLRMI